MVDVTTCYLIQPQSHQNVSTKRNIWEISHYINL